MQADALEPLFPDRDSAEPLSRQLTRRLRGAIESGFYQPSSRLLPRRELALRLGLARNTVEFAIDQLIAEGYLESRVGSGTYVVARVTRPAAQAEAVPHPLPATAERFACADEIVSGDTMGLGPLRAGVPDLSFFPHATWARITRSKLATLSQYLGYRDSQGEPALRAAVAQHVQQFRGVTADEQRVVIVEGTQAAIRLATDVLLAENDTALVEDPCYPFAYAGLRARNIRLVPIPVDDDGIDASVAPPARVALVSPSHQFPMGSRLSLPRRRALLRWASENDAYVIEDDYDSEYAFDGKPLPALQSIDRDERVIYVGTFSKTLAPGLRLGYMIVPQHLAHLFALGRFVSSLGGPFYVQATLADFLSEGHFARYVRKMTRIYGERRRALERLLEEGLPRRGFRLGSVHSGLSLSIIAPSDFDDVAVRDELDAEGVWVQTLSAFCIERTDCRGFVIGYGAESLPETLDATRALVRVIRRHAGLRG